MKWFLLLPAALFASISEPPRLEWLTGYRNDRIHWHTTEASERIRNIQFWENALSFQVMHRDLAVYAYAGYGAFHGWAFDGAGHLGYAILLTPDRTYRVALVPFAGFSGHIEAVEMFQQTWYGPYVGGAFHIEPGGRSLFKAGYAYHWLHLDATNRGPSPFSLSTWGNFGHSIFLEGQARLDRCWNLGAALTMNYYFSGNHPLLTSVPQTFKLRWFHISGLLTVSRSI